MKDSKPISESDMLQSCQFKKCVVIGGAAVGKTQITCQLDSLSSYRDKYQETNGIDFKCVAFGGYVIHFFDTAANSKVRGTMLPYYYQGAHCALLVYDIEKEDALDTARDWVDVFRENGPKDVPILLVGNKADSLEPRTEHSQAKEFATKHGLIFLGAVSAKTKEGIEGLLIGLLSRALNVKLPLDGFGKMIRGAVGHAWNYNASKVARVYLEQGGSLFRASLIRYVWSEGKTKEELKRRAKHNAEGASAGTIRRMSGLG